MIAQYWEDRSFAVKTLVLVLVLVSFTLITGVRYRSLVEKIGEMGISQTAETMLSDYKNELKDIVDMTAVTLSSAVEGIDDDGRIHDIFSQMVKTARFFPDRSGYIFIYKKGGTVFVHPLQPELEGKNIIDFKDPTGKMLIKELDEISQRGGGYVDYMWQKPYHGLAPKLSYARMMPGDRYWIGAGVYIDDIQTKQEAILEAEKRLTGSYLRSLYLGLGCALILIVLPLTWLLIRSIVAPVRELTVVADKFSRGRTDLDIPYTERADEIGRMAKALNRLGMSIKIAAARLK